MENPTKMDDAKRWPHFRKPPNNICKVANDLSSSHFQVCSCCISFPAGISHSFAGWMHQPFFLLISCSWFLKCILASHPACTTLNINIICGFVLCLSWFSPLFGIESDWLKAITASTNYNYNQSTPYMGWLYKSFVSWFIFWKSSRTPHHLPQKLRLSTFLKKYGATRIHWFIADSQIRIETAACTPKPSKTCKDYGHENAVFVDAILLTYIYGSDLTKCRNKVRGRRCPGAHGRSASAWRWEAHRLGYGGGFHRTPNNGWEKTENPIKMDDLGVPVFQETSTWCLALVRAWGLRRGHPSRSTGGQREGWL